MKKVFMKKPFPKMILRILLVCVLLLGFLGFFIWTTILAHLLPIWNQIFAIYRRFQRIGSLREMFPIRWQPISPIPKIGAIILFLST